mgnify:CR=1 FL=1
MIKLNNKFKMTKKEIEQYNLLPDNLPNNDLSMKEIDFVYSLYYKYIELNIDNKISGCELYLGNNREFTKNWAGGKRTLKSQAQRFVLSQLVNINENYNKMSNKKMLDFLFSSIDSMRHFRVLIQYCFKTEGVGWTLNSK